MQSPTEKAQMDKMDKSVDVILTQNRIGPVQLSHSAQYIVHTIGAQCTTRATATTARSTSTSRAGGSRHRRRPRSIQRGGDDHMNDWVTFACREIIDPGAKEFTKLQLYTLVVFANIIKLLEINTTNLHEATAIEILRIIRSNLRSVEILGAYVQSCLVTSLTISQDELASVAAKNFLVYALLSEIDNYMDSIAGFRMADIVLFVVPKIISVASYLITMPATITSVSGITLLGAIHGYFYPDPERIKWTIGRSDSSVTIFEHTRTIANAVYQNRYLATKNLFLATIKRIANVISITRQVAIAARGILRGNPDAVTGACRAVANQTLESMSGPVTLDTLKRMSEYTHQILTEIGAKLPAYTVKVNQVLNMNIDCTSDDLEHCNLAMAPALQPAAEPAAVASSASASTSPVAAAPAAVVLRDISHPPDVQQIMVPHSSSVPNTTAVQPPPQYRSRIYLAEQRKKSKPGNGGSSKHKKKHPRSTNKRKLLVKRIRRRSMKHKKKGKW